MSWGKYLLWPWVPFRPSNIDPTMIHTHAKLIQTSPVRSQENSNFLTLPASSKSSVLLLELKFLPISKSNQLQRIPEASRGNEHLKWCLCSVRIRLTYGERLGLGLWKKGWVSARLGHRNGSHWPLVPGPDHVSLTVLKLNPSPGRYD